MLKMLYLMVYIEKTLFSTLDITDLIFLADFNKLQSSAFIEASKKGIP